MSLQSIRTTPPSLGPNPLQKALDDYHRMEAELDAVKAAAQAVTDQNRALVSEVSMLREALERSDSDRIRLQAISSTLMGRLLAINDTIAGAVRAAIKDGIEASNETKLNPELEKAAGEAQEIIQRIRPTGPQEEGSFAAITPPQPPEIDWSRYPLGG